MLDRDIDDSEDKRWAQAPGAVKAGLALSLADFELP